MRIDERSQKPEGSSQKPKDAGLELLLREGLGHALDRQRGRAGAAFQRATQNPEFGIQNSDWRRLRFWSAAALAMAACLAVVITLHGFGKTNTTVTPEVAHADPSPGTPAVARTDPPAMPPDSTPTLTSGIHPTLPLGVPVMNRVDYSRDIDAGTVVLDNMPVRVVRHQTLQHIEWVDPADKATYSVTEPVEKVGYVRLKPY